MLEKTNIKQINKRDKQLPQNFEQLIEMYDLDNVWNQIDKIIDYINEKEK